MALKLFTKIEFTSKLIFYRVCQESILVVVLTFDPGSTDMH